MKTRLTPEYDKGFVLELYKAFVSDALSAARGTGDLYIFYWPEDKEKMVRQWLGNNFNLVAQDGTDIGEKMAGAFRYIFNRGYEKAVLIGTDIPRLSRDLIDQAFLLLDDNDVGLGPSKDGGYYLISMNKGAYTKKVFENVDWSTPEVMNQTLNQLDCLKLSSGKIKILNDIDTPEDLADLVELMKQESFIGKETRRQLCRILI